ncbi:MAG: succinyl-diaminopimelate desuccinylase [Actinobacteria bacterium]|nr:succinyl-diaminopimelate desuccinylase [Actinomycetota bacterium]
MNATAAQRVLDRTVELVDIPSESFGEGPIVGHLEALLRAVPHLNVDRVGDNLVARTSLGRSQRVVLAGHTDTIPANGNTSARVDGDVLWGLGTADMKGGLAVMVELARTLSEPSVDVTYVFYAREEVASAHSGLEELFVQRPDLLVGDIAILGEPTDGSVEAGCQGTLRARITLQGRRAHTARPWMGRNAIHRLGALLATLEAYEARRPLVDGLEFREAVQAVAVEGGVAGNVVPDEAMVVVNHRFAPDRDEEAALAALRALVAPHLEDGDTVECTESAPAGVPGLGHPLLARLVELAPGPVGAKLGWTDVARFSARGVPAVNFGPGDATYAHRADEHVQVASLATVHDVLWRLLTDDGAR